MEAFIGGDDALKPCVCHFMGRYTDQAAQLAVSANQCAHGIFHAPITPFDDGVLWPGRIHQEVEWNLFKNVINNDQF